MKKSIYSEFAYILGLVLLAFGTALLERADFGMSMIVAPAYLFHLKISTYYSFFSFGMAEYCFQLLLIVLLSIVLRKFKKGYIFTFVTAFLYGVVLDLCVKLAVYFPVDNFVFRAIYFASGLVICTLGVAFLFHTYFAPEAYEVVVKEVSTRLGKDIGRVKIVYDLSSFTLSVILSFLFFGFGHFEGIKWGTLITAFLNGFLIGKFSKFMDNNLEFPDLLKWRNFFEN